MLKLVRTVTLLTLLGTALTGCAVNRATATVDPSTNLAAIKSVHVVKNPDDDGIVRDMVVKKFQSLGHTVTTSVDRPAGVDAWVVYLDKWAWDLTMYMLELTIIIRDPKTDFVMASGNSYHTSLSRKSPTEMIDEVVGNIYAKQGK